MRLAANGRPLYAAGFVTLCCFVAEAVNRIVPEPYLDEIFHVPQAEQYCRGRWLSWDPMITTPPGIYILSVLLHRALALILPWEGGVPLCHSPRWLRGTNLLLLFMVPRLVRKIAESTNSSGTARADQKVPPRVSGPRETVAVLRAAATDPEGSAARARQAMGSQRSSARDKQDLALSIAAHNVALLPPLWFFGFLYYTDIGGVITVLGSLLASRRQRPGLAALLGLASVFFRQTNIVWVAFILGDLVLNTVAEVQPQCNSPATNQNVFTQLHILLRAVREDKSTRLRLVGLLLRFLPVFAAFGLFLRWNGGIVLGDKSNHVAVVHIPQLFYFAAFSVVFGWPALLLTTPGASVRRLASRALRQLVGSIPRCIASISLLGVMSFAILKTTIAHPFLLADNRHYSFYVWRRILNFHPLSRYALAPGYLLCFALLFNALGEANSPLWIVGFGASASLTLVPTPLIEPRYYLVPFVLLRIHLHSLQRGASGRQLWLLGIEAIYFVAINAVTMTLFLARPFEWPSEPGKLQRFMW